MNYLFVYVDGYDLDDVEKPLLKAFEAFVRIWPAPSARVINDKFEPEADDQPDWLPEWNLGLNLNSTNCLEVGSKSSSGFSPSLPKKRVESS